MFNILKKLSMETETSVDPVEDVLYDSSETKEDKYSKMRQQPTLLSAVEGTLRSFFKDDGDELLERLETENIQVYFDDFLPAEEGAGYFEPDDNVIVLSSQPDDILEISKEFHRVLSTIN